MFQEWTQHVQGPGSESWRSWEEVGEAWRDRAHGSY